MTLRQLEKALEASLNEGECPEDAINTYIEKQWPIDAAASAKLHDELVKLALSQQELTAAFIESLVRLEPCLLHKDQLKWWFSKLIPLAVDSGGYNNAAVKQSRNFILAVLSGEVDDKGLEPLAEAQAVKYLEWVIEIYGDTESNWLEPFVGDDAEERRRFVRFNCRNLILENATVNPEDTFKTLEKFLLRPSYRLDVLQIISEYVSGSQTGKLFQIANTPLLDSLIRCLEYDQVEVVLTIAATTLAMILPHVCEKLVPLLPRLYACYGRLCSWQPLASLTDGISEEAATTDVPGSKQSQADGEENSKWLALKYDEDSPNHSDRTPTVETLFMFLYGMFPNNTLKFCRQANDYLTQAHYTRPFDDFWDRYTIMRKTEKVFVSFALNPLLLSLTVEQEIDPSLNRWQQYKSVTEIIMQCVDLQVGRDETGRTGDFADVNEEERLNALLADHRRLFESTLSQAASFPLLGFEGGTTEERRPPLRRSRFFNDLSMAPQRSYGSSRAPSVATSAATSPLLNPQYARGRSPDPTLASMPNSVNRATSPRLSVGLRSGTVDMHSSFNGFSSSRQRITRGRSLSQPPQRSPTSEKPIPLTSSPQVTPTVASVSEATTSASGEVTLEPITEGRSQSPTSSPSFSQQQHNNLIVQYFVRELLLTKNEVDFANFTKYVIERKLVKLQKRLAQLEIANTRLEFAAAGDKRLKLRLKELDEESRRSQTHARTLLRQRTAYESSLLEKNRDLRLQIAQKAEECEKLVVEKKRLEFERKELEKQGLEREEALARIEIELEHKEKVLEQEEAKDALEEQADIKQDEKGKIIESQWEEKYGEAVSELEAVQLDFKKDLESLKQENARLRGLLARLDRRDDDALDHTKSTRQQSVPQEIHNAQASRYAKLSDAHEALLVKFADLERELQARRVHEEERMNELRTALMSTRPFILQDNDSKFEPRVRGRGGAQKTVKRN